MGWTYPVGILFRSNISRNQSEIAIFFPFFGAEVPFTGDSYFGLVGADEICPSFRAHFMRP